MTNNRNTLVVCRKTERMDSPIPTTFYHINEFTINGFIASVQDLDGVGVRFKLIHKDVISREDLVLRCFIFPEVRGQSISIPRKILRKGSEVIVRGEMRANNYLDRSGNEHKNIDYIAFHVAPNNGGACFDHE